MSGIGSIIFDERLKKALYNDTDPIHKKLQETGSAWDMMLWIMFETSWVTGFVRIRQCEYNHVLTTPIRLYFYSFGPCWSACLAASTKALVTLTFIRGTRTESTLRS